MIQGVDLLGDYRLDLGPDERLTFALNATYLAIQQQLVPDAPVVRRAGTLFNPPNWRGRGSVTWSKGTFTLNATASYIAGIDDVRTSPSIEVEGMTTFDFTLRYAFQAERGPLSGVSARLTVQNAFDAHPDSIRTTAFSDTAYDSTNYSPVGRYLGFGLVKSW